MTRWWAVLTLVAGCGPVAFDGSASDARGDGALEAPTFEADFQAGAPASLQFARAAR